MSKNLQRFLKSVESNFNFYTSEYYLARTWLEFRANLNDYLYPATPMGDEEETEKYLARISPDQAVTYSGYLVEMWDLNKKLIEGIAVNKVPKKDWLKTDKRRRELTEAAELTKKFYANSIERKHQYDNS